MMRYTVRYSADTAGHVRDAPAARSIFMAGALMVGVALGMGQGMAQVRATASPIVNLSCGTAPPHLCRAMMQAVVTLSGGHYDIRLVDPADTTPRHDTDLALALTIDGRGKSWIAAHLDWQAGPGGERRSGPSVELGVMDAELNQKMFDRYAKTLLRADKALSALVTREYETRDPEHNTTPED